MGFNLRVLLSSENIHKEGVRTGINMLHSFFISKVSLCESKIDKALTVLIKPFIYASIIILKTKCGHWVPT